MKVLVVRSEFGGRERGCKITDPREIEAVLAGEHAQHVSVAEHEEPTLEAAPAEPVKKKSK